jgi:two-component system, LuxR family, response regulator DctR
VAPVQSEQARTAPARVLTPMVPADVPPPRSRIAVVEFDEAVRTALVRLIRTASCDAEGFGSAEAFLASTSRYACVLVDMRLPGLSALDLDRHLRTAADLTPVIFMSASGETLAREISRRTGRPCLAKPVDGIQLLIAVSLAVQPGG